MPYAKIHYWPPKGGAFAPPLHPLNPPLDCVSFYTVQDLVTHFCLVSGPPSFYSSLCIRNNSCMKAKEQLLLFIQRKGKPVKELKPLSLLIEESELWAK